MLGIDAKAARSAWTVFFVALVLLVIYRIRETLVIFIIALFFAYMITPLVDFIHRYTPARISRTASLTIVYILLVGLLATGGSLLGSRIAEESRTLVSRLPELAEKAEGYTMRPVPAWLEPVRARAIEMIRSQFSGGDKIAALLKTTGQRILSVAGNLIFIILIPLLGFYFLKDGKQMRRTMLGYFTNESQRHFLSGLVADIHVLLGQYMRALLVLSVLTFVFYSVFFMIVGVPYAVLLAGFASVLEFIPFIGPLIGMLTVMIVAGISGFPHLIWIVIFVLSYQVFQNYVIQPLVMSSGVEIHPLLVLFGVMAGEQIGGLAGVFLSIPIIAILRIILVRITKARQRAEVVESAISASPAPLLPQ